MNTALPLTGERTMPGVASENYWFRRHEAAYNFLRDQLRAGVDDIEILLDVGSGEGYGAAAFTGVARTVVALDYNEPSAAHAARRYPALVATVGNLAALPLRTDGVDVLTCLQVIEHVWDHRQFLDECVRVLGPRGTLMMTTPNRLTFSPGADRPLNPFHTHEFTADELALLVTNSGLNAIEQYGLYAGERLAELDERYRDVGGFVGAQLAAPADEWAPGLAADVSTIGVDDFQVRVGAEPDCLDLMIVAGRQ